MKLIKAIIISITCLMVSACLDSVEKMDISADGQVTYKMKVFAEASMVSMMGEEMTPESFCGSLSLKEKDGVTISNGIAYEGSKLVCESSAVGHIADFGELMSGGGPDAEPELAIAIVSLGDEKYNIVSEMQYTGNPDQTAEEVEQERMMLAMMLDGKMATFDLTAPMITEVSEGEAEAGHYQWQRPWSILVNGQKHGFTATVSLN